MARDAGLSTPMKALGAGSSAASRSCESRLYPPPLIAAIARYSTVWSLECWAGLPQTACTSRRGLYASGTERTSTTLIPALWIGIAPRGRRRRDR